MSKMGDSEAEDSTVQQRIETKEKKTEGGAFNKNTDEEAGSSNDLLGVTKAQKKSGDESSTEKAQSCENSSGEENDTSSRGKRIEGKESAAQSCENSSGEENDTSSRV